MTDYERTSKICDYFQLSPILQMALQQEAEEHGCGQIPNDILFCIETRSKCREAGLFTAFKNLFTGLPRPGAKQQSAAVVVPGWLIWAFTHWDSEVKATALSVRLDEAEIKEYAHNHLIEDYGLNIVGIASGSTERALMFLGLGPDRDAEVFKLFLQGARQKI